MKLAVQYVVLYSNNLPTDFRRSAVVQILEIFIFASEIGMSAYYHFAC